MKNSITAAYVAIGESFADDAIVGFVTTVTDAIQAVTRLIETFGALPTILTAVSPLILLLNRNLTGFVTGQQASTSANTSNIAAIRQLIIAKRQLNAAIMPTTASFGLSTRAIQVQTVAVNMLSGAIRGLGVAFRGILAMTGVGIVLAGIGIVLEKLITNFTNAREETKKFEEDLKKQQGAFVDNSAEIKKLTDEYKNLTDKTKLSSDENDRLLEISNRLNELMPQFTDNIDEKGQAHLRSAESIQLEVKYLERLRELENQEKIATFEDDIDSRIEKYQDLQGDLEKVQRLQEQVEGRDRIRHVDDIEEYKIKLQRQEESLLHQMKLLDLESYNLAIDNAQAKMELSEVTQKLTESDQNLLSQFIESNKEMVKLDEVSDGNRQSIYDLSEAVEEYASDLAKLRTQLGEEYDLQILVDSNIDVTTLTDKQIKALKAVHDEVIKGESEWSAYSQTLSDVGLENHAQVVDHTRKKYEGLQEQLSLGLFEDIEGNIPIVSTERLNMLNEEGVVIYRELKGQIVEFTDELENNREELDLTTLSFQELVDHINSFSDDTENATFTLDHYVQALSTVEKELDVLAKAHKELHEEGSLSSSTIQELIKIFPEFGKQTGFQIDAMKAFIKASSEKRIASINDENAQTLNLKGNVRQRIQLLVEELKSIQVVIDARRKARDEAVRAARSGSGSAIDALIADEQWEHSLRAQSNVSSELRELNSIINLLDGSVAGLSDSYHKNTGEADRVAKAAKENEKETKQSIFTTDKYQKALEKLSLELEKVNKVKSQYANWSHRYRSALEKEIKLQEQQLKLNKEQQKSLQNQVRTGNYIQTGMNTISSSPSSTVSASSSTYSGQYSSLINSSATKYGLDPNLIAAVIQAESNFRPNAVSHAGAQGLMQLMPATARELGVTNAFDPAQNIDAGSKYLAQQLKSFGGDIQKALAAYNAGAGNVRKYGGIPPFKETQNYVPKVLDYYNKLAGSSVSSSSSQSTRQLNGWGGTITSGYGMRNGKMHHGIDIAGATGTKLDANVAGKVTYAGWGASGTGLITIAQYISNVITNHYKKYKISLIHGNS